MNLEPQQGMVQPANPVHPPKRPAGAQATQWSGPVLTEAAYDAGRADVLKNGDGSHTFDELYDARMLYHAAFVIAEEEIATLNDLPGSSVKSWRHSTGEKCFGGGWFIVVTTLPTGQISQHYKAEHWDLFQVPEVEIPPKFDGHTTADVHARLRAYLTGDYEEVTTDA